MEPSPLCLMMWVRSSFLTNIFFLWFVPSQFIVFIPFLRWIYHSRWCGSSLPSAHKGPVQPTGHWQEKLPWLSRQMPPFLHGCFRHSVMSVNTHTHTHTRISENQQSNWETVQLAKREITEFCQKTVLRMLLKPTHTSSVHLTEKSSQARTPPPPPPNPILPTQHSLCCSSY